MVPARFDEPPQRVELEIDVLTAARQRVAWAFDAFERIYLSGPSGKDSSVMMHLVCQEARKRGRRVGVLFVDLEAQYEATISHAAEMFDMYADVVDPHWVALPLRLRNAVSMRSPYWVCWDPWRTGDWVREPDPRSWTDPAHYPFYRPPEPPAAGVRMATEFEEFIEQFAEWYADGAPCCCFVGVRTGESLNRWRAIAKDRDSRVDGRPYTCAKSEHVVNVYPIYDWRTEDIWTFVGREQLPYNTIYDAMYRAGLTIHQMRICQPYGDEQRRGLNLFHVLEPHTWPKVAARVAGANSGALYAGKHGNILGNGKVTLPPGHTWESFTLLLLDSLPEYEADHYRDKFAVLIHWWRDNHGLDIRDHADEFDEELRGQFRRMPTWHRLAKCILKNDRMCRSLSFGQHTSGSGSYAKYKALMKRRRNEWGIFPTCPSGS